MNRTRAIQGGIITGFTIAAGVLPGGFDAAHYFLRDWFPGSTVPAWSYLATAPFGLLAWPLAWMAWMAVSVTLLLWALDKLGNDVWMILAPPVLWSLWLGQVEVLIIVGAVLALDVARDRALWWGGVAVLLLLIKPQIGVLVAVWILWHAWKRERVRGLVKVTVVAAALILLSVALWGAWLPQWLDTVSVFKGVGVIENVSIYGLLALSVFLPVLNHKQQLTVGVALMLLLAPYARFYHMAVLIIISGSRLVFVASCFVLLLWLFVGAAWPGVIIPVLALADALRNEGGLSQWRSQQAI